MVNLSCGHQDTHVVGVCNTCQKPICTDCIRQFGYFCSPTCKVQSQSKIQPFFTKEEHIEYKSQTKKSIQIIRWILLVSPIITILVSALIILQPQLSSLGKTIWQLPIQESVEFLNSHNNTLFGIQKNSIWAWELSTGKTKFSTPISKAEPLKNILFFCDNQGIAFTDQHIITFDLEHGQIQSQQNMNGFIQENPILFNEKILLLLHKEKDMENDFLTALQNKSFHNFASVQQTFRILLWDPIQHIDLWQKSIEAYQPIIYTNQNYIYITDIIPVTYEYKNCSDHSQYQHDCLKCHYEIKQPAQMNIFILDQNGTILHNMIKDMATYEIESLNIIPTDMGLIIYDTNHIFIISKDGNTIFQHELLQPARNILLFKNEYIFLVYQNKIQCFSLDSHELHWEKTMGLGYEKAIFYKNWILVDGTPASIPKKEPPLFMSIETESLTSQIKKAPTLYALDIHTGVIKWQRANISGAIHIYDEQIFLMAEKSKINLDDLQRLYGNSSVITSLKPSNGKIRFSKSVDGSCYSFNFTPFGIALCRMTYYMTMNGIEPQEPSIILELIKT